MDNLTKKKENNCNYIIITHCKFINFNHIKIVILLRSYDKIDLYEVF